MNRLGSLEMKLINQFSALAPENRREVLHYLQYVLVMQCKAEYVTQVIHSQVLSTQLMGLVHLPESETYTEEVLERVNKIRFILQSLFEKIYDKYIGLIKDPLIEHNLVKFTYESLDAIEAAAMTGHILRTQREINEFVESYKSLLNDPSRRHIRAV